jgi:catechol 2,3-dioxygenase-like lactoylglutathione lyase family enzyme
MKLGIVMVPVADANRAGDSYKALGWREDAGFAAGADFRVAQADTAGLGMLGHLRHRHHLGRTRLR